MEADAALADLIEISSQIEAAVLFDSKGEIAASTLDDDRSGRVVGSARALLEQASQTRTTGGPVTQLEAAMPDGSVFLAADGDTFLVATTAAEPTAGLIFYDLKKCLRDLATDGADAAA